VTPAILKLRDVRKRTKHYNTGVQYLVTRQNLMLNYVANISFYLLLRAEGKAVTDHPVLEHLLALKRQMTKLQSVDDAVNMQLHDLLTQEFPEEEADDGLDKFIGSKKTSAEKLKRSAAGAGTGKVSKKQKTTKDKNGISEAEKQEAEAFYEAALREKQALQKAKQQLYSHEKPGLASSDEDEDSDLDEGAKRGASFEIIKNKGLKAHKSKLNRNPRVKKRMQFRKAVIRRKGQVRDVRVGEAGRYGGETTGIKSNLTRSRKIRS
jgi:U3 small nucleolar RNA-associated protein 3